MSGEPVKERRRTQEKKLRAASGSGIRAMIGAKSSSLREISSRDWGQLGLVSWDLRI